MSDKRQNNQLWPAFSEENRSEAPKSASRGSESLTAKRRTESPAIEEQLRGVSPTLAAQTAGSAHGPFRIANSPAQLRISYRLL